MSATALTVTTTAAAGTLWPALAAVDGSNGNTFSNTGREAILVNNLSGSSLTVTIVTTGVYRVEAVNYAVADLTATLTNNTSKIFGPFDTGLYSNTVTVSFSSGSSVTAGVLQLGSA